MQRRTPHKVWDSHFTESFFTLLTLWAVLVAVISDFLWNYEQVMGYIEPDQQKWQQKVLDEDNRVEPG